MPPPRAARYLQIVAQAIHYAHQERVLHRDLKPSNILIDRNDEPRVTDFGLARRLDMESDLTVSGHPLGTPSYMPPEQVSVKRAEIGPASDVYSLGAILYHLLTGRPPFLADSLANTFDQILHHEPVAVCLLNDAVPRDLETICLKCLEKEPGKRYPSALALAEDLGRFLRCEPIQARPASAAERVWRWCLRRPAIALTLVGTTAAILAALLLVAWQWRRAEAANAQAVATSRETELRLAEARMNTGQSLQGLATLARLVREYPSDRVAVNRLFAELNYPTFIRPIGPVIHEGQVVWSAHLSPDESRVVTTINTPEAFVWGAIAQPGRSPEMMFRLPHPDKVFLARFSPDGKEIVTACDDQRIGIWDASTGKGVGEAMAQGKDIVTFCLAPNGSNLASALVDGSVQVWDLAGKHLHYNFPPSRETTPDYQFKTPAVRIHDATALAYSADGRLLLCGLRTTAPRIWELGTGKLICELPHSKDVITAEFSPDGTRALTTSYEPSVRVWDAHTGAPLAKELWIPTNPTQAHFSPDSKTVATGFYNHTVSVWDAATGGSLGAPFLHKNDVEDTAFSPEGRWLAVAVHDGSAHIWEALGGRPVAEPVHAAISLRSARFLADGKRFMTRGN